MAIAAIALDLLEALDISENLASEISFDLMFLFHLLAKFVRLIFRKIFDARFRGHAGNRDNFVRGCSADAVDVCERNINALLCRECYSRNTCHRMLLDQSARVVVG